MDDRDIIALFWNRDESAISAVSEKYNHYCWQIAWNIVGSREDSEECVNDTWLSAWTYMPPKRPAILSAFLGKITRGLAIDCLRRKYAAKRMDMHIADVAGEVETLADVAVSTLDEYMEKQELVQLLNTFLKSLPEIDRDIFIRRYWYMDGLKDIAKRHGCSVSKVKSNLFRNRRRLKKYLENEQPQRVVQHCI
ncbi:RNA polymerase sigma factor, sigma-70 family [Marvinbryantia formatexigens DSM 14469]|uniref:RNA polymerase sigma factor, sigma-70 family n=1 Tax=Marvinbryantia formatexigens DSM 14469 TaxID=478749 RepID=C6LD02_9FIRM|nr:sigma-70 family RNA polymerase sigma factor [Marvinbryantia formatexigens]EET61485.1 RNA polymerase sigma factor, sigma-70 family [Marvinbryantia formatexigens DSM 14469]UWO26141.1 sigma-70 family RNA polymerase sigma factor [Marvinbryantia formatexigens DSM 14469]SDF92336.1 RNA polymerase sigma-70 factor, ECF subfamily [Marvinbryantia formatexigens]